MKQLFKVRLILIVLLTSTVLSGCITPVENATTQPPEPTATSVPTLAPVTIAETATPAAGSQTLTIWLPPQFDPNDGSAASSLFNARLEEFSARRSEVRVETRIKEVTGPGGIEDTLLSAGAAAPLALPDLVALPYETLQSAIAKGLLHPFDGLTDTMDDPDWYDFARQLSHVQNSIFGIPFAGDALIMVYRPEFIEEPPTDWETALLNTEPLSFPAADPESLFTLTLYRSSGGAVADDEGGAIMDMTPLTDVLTFYYQASQNGLMPFWLTQFETDDQAWAAYDEGQANMGVTWLSRYLQNPPPDSSATTIPTADGIPYTTATGWVWALVSPDPQRQELAAQLAEFLTTGEFLAQWNAAVGLLPLRPSALVAWENSPQYDLLKLVAPSTQLAPSTEIIQTLGPLLEQSALDVLKEQTDPATAAQNAIEALIAP
ncbi:MAG: extracellular solute-binding protein [Anaerolineales bacterium]|nr:extracellular solute-binding protein [Chloroflexota bacterium]MBL6981924.1 extracellular solute-binding protein [Anaerolineales bacterium]